MTLSRYGRREWLSMIAIAVMASASAAIIGWWWAAGAVLLLLLAFLSLFRDPTRVVPAQRHIMVSPADGRVSAVQHLEHFEPLGEAAVCVRIFLSLLDVHVNRSPCHAIVSSVEHTPGLKRNALDPRSARDNESTLLVLLHPSRRKPVAAVRQVVGMIARTIVCDVTEGQILQRGQRYGMIKFGSTTELYLPKSLQPHVLVEKGQHVRGGLTVVANIGSVPGEAEEAS